jgi:hypothetical protein
MDENVINWLLESKSPSIRYRTEREMLGKTPNVDLRIEIVESKPVQKIFSKMHPDGFWLHRDKGDGIDYAMSSSTHFVLSYLAELGLDKSNEIVNLAVSRYLDLPEQDFQTKQSCLYAHNLRTFILMGYRVDDRIRKRVETLLENVRHDGGYLCIRKNFSEKTKSCIRGTIKALMAYSELPELWEHESCQRTVQYFLNRNIYFKHPDLSEKIRGGMGTIFPFAISSSLLEPLYALSKMGYGKHPALKDAWEQLEKRKTIDGKYILDWHPPSLFTPGKKKEPNEWVTFYAILAKKFRESSTPVV